jgi:hypothetical protein
MTNDKEWHLSKSVPVGMIIGLLMQFGGFVWFASQMEGRITALEDVKTQFEQRLKTDRAFHTEQRIRLWDRLQGVENAATAADQRLARVEAMIQYQNNQIDRLVDNLIGDRKND